ncbi:Fe-S cluster assembly protein SufD [Candidatus Palibaumannia cicadellinicola]|uniref:Iron-sulfur cluster assembly protein n=1 Tax=Candidatus Palibaumannia cicadellinicola TaxID=186490 RepID=A0A0K2BLC9_9GAMM|nr:Fe-S cluster assembly protein SufD [Candidatus Baumannia cicadellinicola]AKZ65999.1 Iron-sulfur cluster assembly protein [Candidatus Baumannia cicadellinicola]
MAGFIKNNNSQAFFLSKWHKLLATSNNLSNNNNAYYHWQKVEKLGLPIINNNNKWKNKQIDSLLSHDFTKLFVNNVSSAECDNISLNLDAYRLVFINGKFISKLSDNYTGNWQVKVELANKLLPMPIYSEVFLHITESLSDETTYIRLTAGKVEKKPIYILHISKTINNNLNILNYRHHIDIENNAKGQVIEHFVSLSNNNLKHFSGARMTINVSDNAYLSHIKLSCETSQCYHFAHNDIIIGNNAIVRDHTVMMSQGITQHQTSMQLNGERSDLLVKSLLLTINKDISDICTYLEHNKGYCISSQLHKIISCNNSKGIFNGIIKVNKNAFQTDSKMINNNLLLGKFAEIYSKPFLEIYNNDVKCSHGATVSCIDNDQMFYLRSRGLTYHDAKQIIISAFTEDIINTIENNNIKNILLNCIKEALNRLLNL